MGKYLSKDLVNQILLEFSICKNSNIVAKKLKIPASTVLRYLRLNNIPLKKDENKLSRCCTICKENKSLVDFKTNSGFPEGKAYICKSCDKERSRNRRLLRLFGISSKEYDDLLKEQNNVCAICGKPESIVHRKTKEVMRLSVDHCHSTGKIRGLLCAKCNMVIGSFNDDIELFRKSIKYLEKT